VDHPSYKYRDRPAEKDNYRVIVYPAIDVDADELIVWNTEVIPSGGGRRDDE